VAGALLVADEDVAQPGRIEERIVRRQDRPAGDAEDGVNAELLEGTDKRLGARHLRLPVSHDRRRLI
jgi:hypothetical protein